MNLERKRKTFHDVDVTSFSDLAFLLIIFFILTTTFVKPMGEKIAIPSGTSDPERKQDKEPPAINLTSESLFFDKEEMTLAELRKKLEGMRLAERKDDDRVIVLESAADVRFQRYFEVMTAVSRAGGVLALLEQQGADGKKGGESDATAAPEA